MEEEYNINDSNLNLIMYKICPKNKDLNFCYIGHTNNFARRKNQHIKNTTKESDKHYHLKHYETIRNNGGWNEWEMSIIEEYKCKTKLEGRMREQELIEEYNANLNTLNAFITEEKRKLTKQQITDKYKAENKELISEQQKKYKEEHKEIIDEQMKKYREENKGKIYEQAKEYRENNKERLKEWDKDWREKNKEILKEKRKLYEAKKKQLKLQDKLKEITNKEELNCKNNENTEIV